MSLAARLNALTGIDGFWTSFFPPYYRDFAIGLNALTGIDGFWTDPGIEDNEEYKES